MERPRDERALLATACVALGLALGASGCRKKHIPVVHDHKDKSGDYGRIALKAAVAVFHDHPTDPAAYRALASQVESLRPRFNKAVSDEAERNLAFLALEPMAAQINRPFPDQAQSLALTVWPTALRVEPKTGETVSAYLARVCHGPLAESCKYVVPEFWPLVLSGVVWDRMKTRAREAYSDCQLCSKDPTYRASLERYDQMQTRVAQAVTKQGDRVQHTAWPEAGPHAAPWTGPPLLDLVSDPPTLGGQAIAGSWRKQLAARPEGARILGLHVRPNQDIGLVRDVVRSAGQAGWREVALEVRERGFPFPMREYRIAAGGGSRRVATVRDIDTAQVLVRALDDALARSGAKPAPAAAPPVRLRGR